MPCRADGLGTGLGPMTEEDCRKLDVNDIGIAKQIALDYQSRLDTLTAMICKSFRRLDREGKPIPHGLRGWWKDHKKFDKQEGR